LVNTRGRGSAAKRRGPSSLRATLASETGGGTALDPLIAPAGQPVISNSLTTRATPEVVDAICAAASASDFETMPIR